jgi:hypothetical protein
MKKNLLIALAAIALLGFPARTFADQAFSNLEQPGGSFWGASTDTEFGSAFHTGAGSFGLNQVTLEQWGYTAQSAASLRVRLLQASQDGFSPVGEFGNPVPSAVPTQLPGVTTYVSFTPLTPITLSANTEYLIAISTVPGAGSQDFLATSFSGDYSSSVGWQPGTDWLGIMASEEFWVSINFAGRLKMAVEATLFNQAPDVSRAVAKNAVLWPPSNNYVPVQILGITDPDGDAVQVAITRIEQDEPVGSGGASLGSPDAVIDSQGNAWVRGQRNGSGNGRVYKVHFTATDGKPGGAADGFVYLTVPHDKGKGASAIDDGPVTGYFDSTRP